VVQDAYAEMVNRSAWAAEMTDAQLDTMLPLQTDQVHCLSPYGSNAAAHVQLHPTEGSCLHLHCGFGKLLFVIRQCPQ